MERVRQGKAGSAVELPVIYPYHLDGGWSPRAVSRRSVTPQGYVNKVIARAACAGAGKRLCTEQEWRTACRGQNNTRFPYGDEYRPGVCNINRQAHPAIILHGVAHDGVLNDPRLNTVGIEGQSLLYQTGGDPDAPVMCRSVWGSDFVYDMVGNIDEWVEGPDPMYLGGFFSRSTKEGCEYRNDRNKHKGPTYYNYSTGFRCCDNPRPVGAAAVDGAPALAPGL